MLTYAAIPANFDWTYAVLAGIVLLFILTWRPFRRLAQDVNIAWARDGDIARSCDATWKLLHSRNPWAILNRLSNRGHLEAILALRFHMLRQSDEAIRWYQKGLAIARKPNVRGLLHTIAACIHADRGEPDEFEKHLAAFKSIEQRQPIPTIDPVNMEIHGLRELGHPERAWAILRDEAIQAGGMPPAKRFNYLVSVLSTLGVYEPIFRLTAWMLAPPTEATPMSPGRPSPDEPNVGEHVVRRAHRSAIELEVAVAVLQAAMRSKQWDLYHQYLEAILACGDTRLLARVLQHGYSAIYAAYLGDRDAAARNIQAMDEIVSAYSRDLNLADARGELAATAWQILGEHERTMAILTAMADIPRSPLQHSKLSALAAVSLEALKQTAEADVRRQEARSLAPAAVWNLPPGKTGVPPAELQQFLGSWATSARNAVRSGMDEAATVGSVAPVASRTAHAAAILGIVSLTPVVGIVSLVALIPIAIVLLTKRNPLAHDRRVGAAALAITALSLFFFGLAAVSVSHYWEQYRLYQQAVASSPHSRPASRPASQTSSQPAPTTTTSAPASRPTTTSIGMREIDMEEIEDGYFEGEEDAEYQAIRNIDSDDEEFVGEPMEEVHEEDTDNRAVADVTTKPANPLHPTAKPEEKKKTRKPIVRLQHHTWHKGADIAIIFVVLILSVMCHEIGHAVAAYWGGDPTARDLGRFSLNPIRHMSLFGSVLLPAALVLINSQSVIGWAKPVPVRFDRLRHPRRGQLVVTLAGVACNLFLALLATHLLLVGGIAMKWLSPDGNVISDINPMNWPYHLMIPMPDLWALWIRAITTTIVVNMALIGLNLLPIPPLDGFGILRALAPRPLQVLMNKLTGWGLLVLLALMSMQGLNRLLQPAIEVAQALLGYAFWTVIYW